MVSAGLERTAPWRREYTGSVWYLLLPIDLCWGERYTTEKRSSVSNIPAHHASWAWPADRPPTATRAGHLWTCTDRIRLCLRAPVGLPAALRGGGRHAPSSHCCGGTVGQGEGRASRHSATPNVHRVSQAFAALISSWDAPKHKEGVVRRFQEPRYVGARLTREIPPCAPGRPKSACLLALEESWMNDSNPTSGEVRLDDRVKRLDSIAIRAARGETAAQEALLHEFRPLIGACVRCYALALTTHSRDELVAQVNYEFLDLTLRFDPARGIPFLAYAPRMLRQRIANLLRRERRHLRRHCLSSEPLHWGGYEDQDWFDRVPADAGGDNGYAAATIRVWWHQVAGSLTVRQRDAMGLRLQGLTEREIAYALGVSQPMVHKLLDCARMRLWAQW